MHVWFAHKSRHRVSSRFVCCRIEKEASQGHPKNKSVLQLLPEAFNLEMVSGAVYEG